MLVKAIPRKLLIHSATLQHITEKDSFGKPTYGGVINLSFVRVEPITKRKIIGSDERTDESTYKVFYDLTNSRPKGVVFLKGDKFTFKGKSLTVREIPEYSSFDGDNAHHYEIGCS